MTQNTQTRSKQTAGAAGHDSELAAAIELTQAMESVKFTPFGETKPMTLTMRDAREMIATPTAKGHQPSDREVWRFMKLCEFRGLNPWLQQAYLIGYDTKFGPKFNSFVAFQSLNMRADAHAQYEGRKCGTLLWDKSKRDLTHWIGDVYPRKEFELLGGWCRVYRSDRKYVAYATTRLEAYDKKSGYWNTDAGWMISKCAQAKALRAAFPNDLAGMYAREEEVAFEESDDQATPKRRKASGKTRVIDMARSTGLADADEVYRSAGDADERVRDHAATEVKEQTATAPTEKTQIPSSDKGELFPMSDEEKAAILAEEKEDSF